VIVFNAKLFQPSAAALGARVDMVTAAMKALPRMPGKSNIFVPGERSFQRFSERVQTDSIKLPRSMYEAIQEKARANPQRQQRARAKGSEGR